MENQPRREKEAPSKVTGAEAEELCKEDARVKEVVDSFRDERLPGGEEEEECPRCKKMMGSVERPMWGLVCCGKGVCCKCMEDERTKMEVFNSCPHCDAESPYGDTIEQKEAITRDCANKGHAWAQFDMACALEGVDDVQSALYYKKAAEQGHVTALCVLSQYYWVGDHPEIPQWEEEGVRLCTIAAKMGDDQAQRSLANHLSKRGERPAEAFRWRTLAAAKGNVFAQRQLGGCYEKFIEAPVTKSCVRAKYWYGKAVRQRLRELPVVCDRMFDEAQDEREAEVHRAMVDYARVMFLVDGRSSLPRVFYWLRKADTEKGKQLLSTLEGLHCSYCAWCQKRNGTATKLPHCGQCKAAYYCDRTCQAKHWKMGHKVDCNGLMAERQEVEFNYM